MAAGCNTMVIMRDAICCFFMNSEQLFAWKSYFLNFRRIFYNINNLPKLEFY